MFSAEVSEIFKAFLRLRHRMIPWLYTQNVKSSEEGKMMLRPLYYDYPEDMSLCFRNRNQYLLGDCLTVCPVTVPMDRETQMGETEVYLPEGTWTHLLDGRQVEGGRWITEKYDFMSLPLWVRENSLLPLGKSSTEVEYDYADGVEIRAYHVTHPAQIEVPDLSGQTQAVYRAGIENGRLVVSSDSPKPWTYTVID